MRNRLESWRAVAAIVAIVVGGTVWVVSRIGALETRVGVVEAKLDLVIEALGIQAAGSTAASRSVTAVGP